MGPREQYDGDTQLYLLYWHRFTRLHQITNHFNLGSLQSSFSRSIRRLMNEESLFASTSDLPAHFAGRHCAHQERSRFVLPYNERDVAIFAP